MHIRRLNHTQLFGSKAASFLLQSPSADGLELRPSFFAFLFLASNLRRHFQHNLNFHSPTSSSVALLCGF